jgi:hypothetical protein
MLAKVCSAAVNGTEAYPARLGVALSEAGSRWWSVHENVLFLMASVPGIVQGSAIMLRWWLFRRDGQGAELHQGEPRLPDVLLAGPDEPRGRQPDEDHVVGHLHGLLEERAELGKGRVANHLFLASLCGLCALPQAGLMNQSRSAEKAMPACRACAPAVETR